MLYSHTVEDCLAAAVGAGGLEARSLERRLAACKSGLATLKTWHEKERLPLLTLPQRKDDLAALEEIAAEWRLRFADVVVLGPGGSAPVMLSPGTVDS